MPVAIQDSMPSAAASNEIDLYDYFGEMLEQPPIRSSEQFGWTGGRWEQHVELTVRRSPAPGSRWVLILSSEDLEITGFANRPGALRAYRDLVRECEADAAQYGEHAWHTTDVRGIPLRPDRT